MATYSVNKAILIGNLTRDPELKYTSQGTAVCSFGVATNRGWTTQEGEAREAADFHNIVAWRKLAEICNQILSKGRKVYLSGRMQTRDWTGDDGVKRYRTEVVLDEMIALDAPPAGTTSARPATSVPGPAKPETKPEVKAPAKPTPEPPKESSKKKDEAEEVQPDDIPF